MKIWRWLKELLSENIIVVILVLTTWAKLVWVDQIMFDDPKKLSALIFVAFTAASSLLIFSPVLLFNKFKNAISLTLGLLVSVMLWADIVYYRYFGSLIKVEALAIVNQATSVGSSVLTLLSWMDVLFFVDILIIFVYLLVRKRDLIKVRPLKARLAMTFVVAIIALLPISGIFWRDRSEHLKNFIFHNYDINTIEFRYGALGAHGINSFRYILTALEHLDETERDTAVNWIKKNAVGQTTNEYSGIAEDKNIIMIQIESLQSFVIDRTYEGQEITPNLNRLITNSYYLKNGTTEIGGGNTSDSDFVANTSLCALRDSAAFVQYGKNDFTSLAKALKKEGYTANAYHAYRRDFWNRGVALNSLGFEHFFARDEYSEGENIIMGLNDESFYRQTLDKLVINEEKPAFNFLVSLTSHHPFIMATEHQLLRGNITEADEKTYHYYQAIHYADYALGIFLDELKERGLYEDSLIVVYGDHTAKVGDYSDPRMASMLGTFEPEEMSAIPFIYKLPLQSKGEKLLHTTSQLDIMPTTLNLTGTKTDFPMFGGDALTGIKKNISKEEAVHYSDLMIRFNLFEEFTKF